MSIKVAGILPYFAQM